LDGWGGGIICLSTKKLDPLSQRRHGLKSRFTNIILPYFTSGAFYLVCILVGRQWHNAPTTFSWTLIQVIKRQICELEANNI